jgi:AcrR family transcriptional regulator
VIFPTPHSAPVGHGLGHALVTGSAAIHTSHVNEEGLWHRLPVSQWSDHRLTASRQARATGTRRILLLAASRRFATEGYHGTSLTKILSDTESTKGALYFHFPSKAALGWAVVNEVHTSWDDIAHRIASRGLDPLQALLVVYDAQIARLMHDPIVRGGLRVIREEPSMQGDRHKWVDGWRTDTENLLELANERRLLVPDADPVAVSSTLLATIIGHHHLAETQPDGGPSTWDRMNTTWLGLLPAIATDEWVDRWLRSGWKNRPAPTREQYEEGRK